MEPAAADFTTVAHKKQPRPSRNRKGKHKVVERTLAERVLARRKMLETAGYVRDCTDLFRSRIEPSTDTIPCPTPTCVVCLGLGSVASSSKSQDQFVLLQDLVKELGSSLTRPTRIYDPVFDDDDVEFFENEGMQVLRSEHDLSFAETTLLYMPHCPRSLYELLLERNWDPDSLRRLVIIGNRLDMYEDPTHASASSGAKSPHISKASRIFNIASLPSAKDHLEAFNDLALQWVEPARLPPIDSSFWSASSSGGELNNDADTCAKSLSDDQAVDSTVKSERDRLERDLIAALSRTTLE